MSSLYTGNGADGVCYNCLNNFHEGCAGNCKCAKGGHKNTSWWLNKELPIYFGSKLVKEVKWDKMNFGGKLKIKVSKHLFEVDINELSNFKN